jgi:hypothetical protein
LDQNAGKIAGNIFVLVFSADDHRDGMLLGLKSCFLLVKSHTAIKETVIKNLDECCEAKKVKDDFPQMIPQYYPIHKQRWFGG